MEEAEKISAALPVGRGFTCLDTTTLPAIFKRIFSETIQRSSL